MKNKIALITDSTCDLPQKLLKKYSINLLPLKIIFGKTEYNDRIDISPKKVYQLMKDKIPTTSMPTPYEIKNKFQELKENGVTHAIAINISSGLSNTYNNIKLISKHIEGLKIEVFDSKALSMGLGRIVIYAAKLIENGLPFNEICKKIDERISDIELFFVVKTLDYLIRGGRIGKVKGKIGQLLNIKPIIAINEEGKYYTYKQERSRKKSLNRLYQIIKDKIKDDQSYVIDVMHADAFEEAKELIDRFKKLKNVKDTFLGELGPAMVVHSGPGLIGVCISKYE